MRSLFKPQRQRPWIGAGSAPVFFLMMLQGNLCHIAKPTGGLYLPMSLIEIWVRGGMVNK
jgi:hypothetical protein